MAKHIRFAKDTLIRVYVYRCRLYPKTTNPFEDCEDNDLIQCIVNTFHENGSVSVLHPDNSERIVEIPREYWQEHHDQKRASNTKALITINDIEEYVAAARLRGHCYELQNSSNRLSGKKRYQNILLRIIDSLKYTFVKNREQQIIMKNPKRYIPLEDEKKIMEYEQELEDVNVEIESLEHLCHELQNQCDNQLQFGRIPKKKSRTPKKRTQKSRTPKKRRSISNRV